MDQGLDLPPPVHNSNHSPTVLEELGSIIPIFENDLSLEDMQKGLAKSRDAKRAAKKQVVTDPDEIATKLTRPCSKVKMFSQKFNKGSNHNWGANPDQPASGSARPTQSRYG